MMRVPILLLMVGLILAISLSGTTPTPLKNPIPQREESLERDEQRDLATFIHWTVPRPNDSTSTTPTFTTTPTPHPTLVPEDTATTPTIPSKPLSKLESTTSDAPIPGPPMTTAAAPTSTLPPMTSTTPTPTLEVILVPQINIQNSSSDPQNPNKEMTIYVIRQGPSGSVVGIVREALGLVANTIRVVGLNLSLLGGPILLGIRGPSGSGPLFPPSSRLTRINATHFRLVGPPRGGVNGLIPSSANSPTFPTLNISG